MKGELKSNSSFSEMKIFFEANRNNLPTCLDGGFKYYKNVEFTMDLYIYRIESEIKRLGFKEIKNSIVAKTSKRNLYFLYLDLQNKEGWNASQWEYSPFRNKMFI